MSEYMSLAEAEAWQPAATGPQELADWEREVLASVRPGTGEERRDGHNTQ